MKTLVLVVALLWGASGAAWAQTPTQSVYAALLKNKPADIEALLKAGADANAPVEMVPGFPTTFLILAAERSLPDVVKVLLQYKADANKTDSFLATPLMTAAAEGNLDIVTQLLAAGANPKAKDNEGNDALAHAKKGGHAEVVKLLQSKK